MISCCFEVIEIIVIIVSGAHIWTFMSAYGRTTVTQFANLGKHGTQATKYPVQPDGQIDDPLYRNIILAIQNTPRNFEIN